MAIRMRLRRTGKKKQAYYRVVVADSTSPRDGRFVEVVGHYTPGQNPPRVEFDEERVLHWLKQGARPTDTVRSLLSRKGLLARLAEDKPGHALLRRAPSGSRLKRGSAAPKASPDRGESPAQGEAGA